MRKTSVYLTERERQRLAHLAAQEGRSQAEIVRAAIEAYEPARPRARRFALEGCVSGDGTSAADIPEEEYLKGFGE